MKTRPKRKFPRGWNEKKVRELIAYYDNQTDEEGAAEIEAAEEASSQIWISVPTELVPAVARLIENHEQKNSKPRRRNGRASKSRLKSSRT